jgi:hypothetical protein
VKSRSIGWTGNVAWMSGKGIHTKFLPESFKERDHLKNLGVDGRKILK